MPRRAPLTDAQRAEAIQAVIAGATLRPVARRYGLSHVHLRRLVLAQRLAQPAPRQCAVCGKEPKLPRLDHCVATGRPRGILCQLCTIALAAINEDPLRADALAVYSRACVTFRSQRR